MIKDVYTDAYGDDDTTDTSASAAPRLAGLIAGAAQWGVRILDAMSSADPDSVTADPSAQARSVAQDAAVSANAAASLDAAVADGNQVQFVPDSDPCPQCSDAAGTYDPSDIDDDIVPPLHKSCECTLRELKSTTT